MKTLAKNFVANILGWQVRQLLKRHNLTIIAVVGSIGKTSTKYAIAEVLEKNRQVRWQRGNYNDIVSVPLVFFGTSMPSLFNPIAWLKVFIDNQFQITTYEYDTVVVELGTDGPGQIKQFKKYLNIDIAVVTSVAPEHMEFFKTLDAVAAEELSVREFSKKLLVNSDLVAEKYRTKLKAKTISYGTHAADYIIHEKPKLSIKKQRKAWVEDGVVVSTAQAYSKTAAAIVAEQLGLSVEEIEQGLGVVRAVPGRLQVLPGINDTLIIDDTYNASPDATMAALYTLYQRKAKHKIALLGNMNELGEYSKDAHTQIGEYCNPKQLDLVVTVGPEANKYLALAAEKKGCKVKKFNNPYEAGRYVQDHLKKDTVVLAKGSQNNVYMEEAVKLLLADPNDETKLVRQTKEWHKKKQDNFATRS